MDVNLLISGLLIGFGIAAPVGPIGVLCIKRTLNEGRLVGLATGLGAATADALYGLIAGLGLTSISSLLVEQRGWLQLFGGLFLLYLGVRTFASRPPAGAAPAVLRLAVGQTSLPAAIPQPRLTAPRSFALQRAVSNTVCQTAPVFGSGSRNSIASELALHRNSK